MEIEDAKVGIIIEVKYAQEAQMDTVCRNALEQIEKKGYARELCEDGMQTVLKYGIACYKKTCKVMSVTSL